MKSRVTILVKAYPQPSKAHSETVCCAGLDASGSWKRLFPIRFRQLSDDQSFKRWSIVEFKYSQPTRDNRRESCRVHEESIEVVDQVTRDQTKENLVNPAIVASQLEAASKGASLAIIRPTDVKMRSRKLSNSELEEARASFQAQARQTTMFDKELDAIEPCPFEFKMIFKDGDGKQREKKCSDWETSAAFFSLRRQGYDEEHIRKHLEQTYCEDYVRKGIVFALGNIAARPSQWQLLGIFPIRETQQDSFI